MIEIQARLPVDSFALFALIIIQSQGISARPLQHSLTSSTATQGSEVHVPGHRQELRPGLGTGLPLQVSHEGSVAIHSIPQGRNSKEWVATFYLSQKDKFLMPPAF